MIFQNLIPQPYVASESRQALKENTGNLKSWDLTQRQICDLELIMKDREKIASAKVKTLLFDKFLKIIDKNLSHRKKISSYLYSQLTGRMVSDQKSCALLRYSMLVKDRSKMMKIFGKIDFK